MHWTQVYDPFGHWWLSTLVARFRFVVLFGLLVGLRVKPHWCAAAGAMTARGRGRCFSACRRSSPPLVLDTASRSGC